MAYRRSCIGVWWTLTILGTCIQGEEVGYLSGMSIYQMLLFPYSENQGRSAVGLSLQRSLCEPIHYYQYVTDGSPVTS